MAASRQSGIDPQAVRSHVRRKSFWMFAIAPWPIGALAGLLVSLVFGTGLAIGIACGLAVAFGVTFVGIVVGLEIDDGDVNDRVQKRDTREAGEHRPPVQDSKKAVGAGARR